MFWVTRRSLGNPKNRFNKKLKSVRLQGITLQEFSPTRKVEVLEARVMDAECRYDIIFGRDFCSLYGINLNFQDHEVQAIGIAIPMLTSIPDRQERELTPAEILEREHEDAMLMSAYEDEEYDPLHQGYKSKTFKQAA